jgi:CRP-like cAMP-binding protein
MLALESTAAAAHLKSRFLDGLARCEFKVVLAAARQRHSLAKCVIVSQGHPADHLFLLTKGRAQFFFHTPEGKKVVLL